MSHQPVTIRTEDLKTPSNCELNGMIRLRPEDRYGMQLNYATATKDNKTFMLLYDIEGVHYLVRIR